MGAFNFSVAGVQAQSTGSKRLKPWDIYEVKFMGCRVDHINGKKDPTAVYDILKVRFEGEEGYYEESIFFPKNGDDERPKYTNKEGHEFSGPSNWEQTKQFIAQLAAVINPSGWIKMQEISKSFKSFDDMCNALIKITDKNKEKVVYLKVVGKSKDNMVTPCLPKAAGLNKDGEIFPVNFISDSKNNLFFSEYEANKRSEYLNTKPTKINNEVSKPTSSNQVVDSPAPAAENTSEDIDDLLAGI